MKSETFYIAELGVGCKNTIEKDVKQINVLGASFNAIEIFETPFDAIRALNKTTKLMPEHHVTVYQSIDNCKPITISNDLESIILATANTIFKKYQTMALGSLVYSL